MWVGNCGAAGVQAQGLSRLFSPPLRDTEGRERQAARGVAAGSCDRRLRHPDSREGVRDGELGGPERELDEVMIRVLPSVEGKKKREEAEKMNEVG